LNFWSRSRNSLTPAISRSSPYRRASATRQRQPAFADFLREAACAGGMLRDLVAYTAIFLLDPFAVVALRRGRSFHPDFKNLGRRFEMTLEPVSCAADAEALVRRLRAAQQRHRAARQAGRILVPLHHAMRRGQALDQ